MRLRELLTRMLHEVELPKGGDADAAKRNPDKTPARVIVRKGKTRAATRSIPLPAFVVAALQRHKAATPRYGPAEPVFLGERSYRRLTVAVASQALPRLLTAKGLPRLTAHKLRHGTATLLHAQGVPMRDIADILGHSSPAITARTYAHVGEASKRQAMDRLDEVAGRETG